MERKLERQLAKGKWMLDTLRRLGVINEDLPTTIGRPTGPIISHTLWEDKSKANYDLEPLREEFKDRLYNKQIICTHCNDSHKLPGMIAWHPCNYCPIPCEECLDDSNHRYCEVQPCNCNCHGKDSK